MSLKKIVLNPYNISYLYANSLVGVLNKPKKESANLLKFLGGNSKNILILVQDLENVHIGESDLILLTKMLNACKLTIEDVSILNMAKFQLNLSEIVEKLSPKMVLLFGVSPTEIDMPIMFPEYHVQNYNNMQFLLSAKLNIIANDTVLKTNLWNSLKKMFEI
jgi:hypothetical protein